MHFNAIIMSVYRGFEHLLRRLESWCWDTFNPPPPQIIFVVTSPSPLPNAKLIFMHTTKSQHLNFALGGGEEEMEQ